ncbi:unnamed protein product [Protopolystoma xenopodis]|uniref:Uncharacterized protein n=1 Tax=Protopolystoma xenopodis TaxID=117903 RepID=A0A448WQ56_9PLAT|nr:unnamed protein product [Protopolystoma xenopodis]
MPRLDSISNFEESRQPERGSSSSGPSLDLPHSSLHESSPDVAAVAPASRPLGLALLPVEPNFSLAMSPAGARASNSRVPYPSSPLDASIRPDDI